MSTEKKEFSYHTYEKIATWRKNMYSIMAESKEEADEKMKELFKKGEIYPECSSDVKWYDGGDYYEGDEEVLSYEDNDNNPTEELYDDDGEKLIDNTPIEVLREQKLIELLGYKNY